ncbi:hypothetical protein NQ317_003014 [Molorchus minor]|uniref:Endonuclease/exonuclease/phosphatase domain-containing protein n=1 Tax=Molorchus minor TaxID=1323400 RepID=A0ABQ9ITE2_9CUCU|nr:hypothetical protein NQ317_003014 [Molorchus minor]
MKIMQVNLGRAWAAHDLAHAVAKEGGNRHTYERQDWIKDSKGDAAIYIYNKNIEVEGISKRNGYVRLKLRGLDIYSCYFSPNISIAEFENHLAILGRDIDGNRREVIVLGDLNAKAVEWGSPHTDKRGNILTDWMASKNLTAQNHGNVPTFVRGDSSSYIDVTLTTSKTGKRLEKWRVSDEESLSLHRYIFFEIGGLTTKRQTEKHKQQIDRTKYKNALGNEIAVIRNNVGSLTPKSCEDIMCKARRKSQSQRINRNNKVPYWWNDDIEVARAKCTTSRRNLTRQKRQAENELEKQIATAEYKRLKKGTKESHQQVQKGPLEQSLRGTKRRRMGGRIPACH